MVRKRARAREREREESLSHALLAQPRIRDAPRGVERGAGLWMAQAKLERQGAM